jgi:hypothetical protein
LPATFEQLDLLIDMRTYFLRPHVSETHGAVFQFGSVITVREWATTGMEFEKRAREWFSHAARLQVRAWIFSTDPAWQEWVDVTGVYPISEEFFVRAQEVDFDMVHPDAPIDLLEELRDSVQERGGEIST